MAQRGRKPKPTAIKELEGNSGKRALNKNEPTPNKSAPKCPVWLDAEAKKEWRRASKQLEALGILTEVDMAAFAGYCITYSRWKDSEEFISKHGMIFKMQGGQLAQVPQITISQNYLKIMIKLCEQFGMTPSSRSRIVADNAQADTSEPMEMLLNGGK